MTDHAVVITLLWIGFVLAITFFASPIRSQAPSLNETTAVELNHVLRHGLNRIETVLAALLLISLRLSGASMQVRLAFALTALVFASQTILLFTRIDAQTLSLLDGGSEAQVHYEAMYLTLAVIKVGSLAVLAALQLRDSRPTGSEIKKRRESEGAGEIESVVEP